ncbi:MAG: hypothetical protein QFX32_05205 [Methanolinea sp.]|nr:hypothetical protein [Methanolinea sp.]
MAGGGREGGGVPGLPGDFFSRPAFLSLTIGIPFCTFKFLFGATALRLGSEGGMFPLAAAGTAVVAWAVADLLMNAGKAVLDALGREAPFEYCTLAQAGAILGLPAVFLAADTLFTFLIICAMLWSGWIALLPPAGTTAWYAATTLNLVSLSLVNLYAEARRARQETAPPG